jgi:DNA-binding GntR family transcriptional regulator
MERNRKPFAADLDQCVRRMVRPARRATVRGYLQEDTAFHRYFFAHCGNTLMEHHYDMVVGKIAALRTHLAQSLITRTLSFAEHQRMAELADQDDSSGMLTILAVHINRTSSPTRRG